MFIKGLGRLGDAYGTCYGEFINRTGATILKGQVVALDLALSATETTSGLPGGEESAFANVVTCTQAFVDDGYPILVATGDILDNKRGQFVIEGVCEVAVLDDDVSTTDTDPGDQITLLVFESAVACQGAVVASHRVLGIATEAGAASTDGTDRQVDASSHRRTVLWNGGRANLGYTRDA